MKMTGLNGNKNDEGGLSTDVLERLHWWAELHGKTEDEAKADFLSYCADALGITSVTDEDEDFILDAAETFVVEKRVMTSSGANTSELVGMFLGPEPKVRDKREMQRLTALIAARQNLNEAIQSGKVARAFVENGVWMLEKANGVVASTQDRFEEGVDPWFLVRDNGMTLALLQDNPDWARHGEPIGPVLWSRVYRFAGNTKEDLMDDVQVLRITVTGSDVESVSKTVRIGEPCRIKVRERKSVNPGWEDSYSGANKFFDNIVYTNDFVDEEDRGLLKPETFMTALDCYVENMVDLMDVYEDKSEHIAGIDNKVGPLVVIKGRVTDINATGWDSDYDPTGKDYTMRVSSFSLQREFSNNMYRREVSVRVHGHLVQNNHAFDFLSDDGWKPYAVKSTVLIFGRLGLKRNDDGDTPTVKAIGVYAVPRLSIAGGEGGNTSLGQFGGGQ